MQTYPYRYYPLKDGRETIISLPCLPEKRSGSCFKRDFSLKYDKNQTLGSLRSKGGLAILMNFRSGNSQTIFIKMLTVSL